MYEFGTSCANLKPAKFRKGGNELMKRESNPIFQIVKGDDNPLTFGPPEHLLVWLRHPKLVFGRDVVENPNVGELRWSDGGWSMQM